VRALAAVNLAVSSAGTLMYERSDTTAQSSPSELVWADRTGNVEPVVPMIRGALGTAVFSPDGTRLAYTERRGRQTDVWIRQLASGASSRLTNGGGSEPRWLPDGRNVSYLSSAGRGVSALFVQPAEGNVPAKLAFEDPEPILDGSWSRSGGWFAYRQFHSSLEDLYATRPGVDSDRVVVAATQANECTPVFSPDGRWIAYTSDESGQSEVYVRPFPDVKAGRWQVSVDGGAEPRWDPKGGELFYVDPKGALWSASYVAQKSFGVASRLQLFAAMEGRTDPGACATRYDVSPRTGRFLLLRRLSPSLGATVVFVENFPGDLKRRMSK
jgi:Tol biopolymer transport system component